MTEGPALNLRNPEHMRQETSLQSQERNGHFHFPSRSLPSLSLSFETKCIHTPKLRADTAHCLSVPPPPGFWRPEEILSCPLWSTIRYCSEQAGTCFQKAAGPGDHVSLLDTINWVMSQSRNEDKFWCLLQLSWEMHSRRPKSHRGRESRTDSLCLWGPHGHR